MAHQDAHIRFASDILRRLGEELNPSVDQGILELVKNAYDANAQECIVELTGTDAPGGSISVRDDGDGMSPEDIIQGWLVLGRSGKDPTQPTRLGRRPAGSKGLGRLAALRLGEVAALRTVRLDNPTEQYELRIDWKKYEHADLVEEVSLGIETVFPTRTVGTSIDIEDVRVRLGRMDVKRLARAMLLLADPFGDDKEGFHPKLLAPEFADLATLVERRYFPEAEYYLQATVNADGVAEARVMDGYGSVLYRADHAELARDRGIDYRYTCPPADFSFWAFNLLATNFQLRPVSLTEVREWLATFGGIHLYVNGLRVSPYGNPGNDWLDINVRRAQRQEERPSTNNSLGRIRVDDSKAQLRQKTDRSGIIEDENFDDLKNFAFDALEFMARRRLEEAEIRRQKEREQSTSTSTRSRQVLSRIIDSSGAANKPELQQAFQRYEKANEQQITALRRDVELYRTLSTAGITAATFAHESAGSPLKVMNLAVSAIERRGPKNFGDKFTSVLGPQIRAVRRAINSLAVLGSVTLSLIESDKRRMRRVDLHEVILETVNLFQPFFEQRRVKVRLDLAASNPYMRASRAAVESILTNLVNNSLVAFERTPNAERNILISTEVVDRIAVLRIDDDGPGIVDIAIRDIWLPGQTSRENGTGLGLTIVKDATTDLGGNVSALRTGDLGGASFAIEFPILGV